MTSLLERAITLVGSDGRRTVLEPSGECAAPRRAVSRAWAEAERGLRMPVFWHEPPEPGAIAEEQPKGEDDLHRLAQAHVVRENGAGSLPQPLNARPLKRVERVKRRRCEQPGPHEVARSEPEVPVGRGRFLEDSGRWRERRQRERHPDLLATLDHGRKLRIHLERPTSGPFRSRVSEELQALSRPSCGPNPKLARPLVPR